MTELEKVLKTSGMQKDDIATSLGIPINQVDVYMSNARKKINIDMIIKLSYACNKTPNELIAAINLDKPISKMKEHEFEYWKQKFHKTETNKMRVRYMYELCKITEIDIPNLLFSVLELTPTLAYSTCKLKRDFNGLGIERLRELQEKYRDKIIPNYTLEEMKEIVRNAGLKRRR
jgi:plasmid maintenance system antidote protein VapI